MRGTFSREVLLQTAFTDSQRKASVQLIPEGSGLQIVPEMQRKEWIKEVTFMNRAELVEAVAKQTGFKKKEADAFVRSLTEVIGSSLAEKEKVQIVGFGTFEVRERAARVGRNPQTGEEIQIAASKLPKFKPGKAFKDALN